MEVLTLVMSFFSKTTHVCSMRPKNLQQTLLL